MSVAGSGGGGGGGAPAAAAAAGCSSCCCCCTGGAAGCGVYHRRRCSRHLLVASCLFLGVMLFCYSFVLCVCYFEPVLLMFVCLFVCLQFGLLRFLWLSPVFASPVSLQYHGLNTCNLKGVGACGARG